MKRLVAVFLVVFCVALSGVALAGPLRVLVTVAPQRAVVRAVAGERAVVSVMVPPGADPHTYEPKPSLMAEAARADVYFSIGLEFERIWLPRFRSANGGLAVVAMDAGIEKLPMEAHGHAGEHGEEHEAHGEREHDHAAMHADPEHAAVVREHHGEEAEAGHGHGHEEHGHEGVLDPHVWLSPELMAVMARTVRDALSAADPEGAAAYAAGCAAFEKRVAAMQADIRAGFAGLSSRRFLVFHPSWGYFAREFGLTQMAVEIGGSEPGPRELAGLLREAGEHGVRAVFVAPQFSRKTAGVVAVELGGTLVEADPLAGDWEANLRLVARRMAEAMKTEGGN